MNRIFLSLVALSVLASCERSAPPPPAEVAEAPASSPAPVAAAPAVRYSSQVDAISGAGESQQALPIADGASVQGAMVSTSGGKLVGLAALVGNYANAATGPFDLEACVNDKCAKSSVDAATSQDNAMLHFALQEPLQVSANDTVRYTFSRKAGLNPIALWTYTADSATDRFSSADPQATGRAPKISLLFE